MKIVRHNKTKSLRVVTKQVREMYPHLTSKDKICTTCRQQINKSVKAQKQNTPEGNLNNFDKYVLQLIYNYLKLIKIITIIIIYN